MQIVINIPDDWERRIACNIRPNTIECGELVESIWNGKMLPKEHYRLIDADALDYICNSDECHIGRICDHCQYHVITEDEINNAPTIIEA